MNSFDWKEYDRHDIGTYPRKQRRYLIYRKGCKKMHFMQWNGTGWASDNNDITHYCNPGKPSRFKKLKRKRNNLFYTLGCKILILFLRNKN